MTCRMETAIGLVNTFNTSKHGVQFWGGQIGSRPCGSNFLPRIDRSIRKTWVSKVLTRMIPVNWSTNNFSVSIKSTRGFDFLGFASGEDGVVGLFGVFGVRGTPSPVMKVQFRKSGILARQAMELTSI